MFLTYKWDFMCFGGPKEGPWETVVGTMTPIPGKFNILYLPPPGVIEFEGIRYLHDHTTILFCQRVDIYKNDALFGLLDFNCCKLDAVNGGWEGRFWLNESDIVKSPRPKCTCGGDACYGTDADLHSFVCDIRKAGY